MGGYWKLELQQEQGWRLELWKDPEQLRDNEAGEILLGQFPKPNFCQARMIRYQEQGDPDVF
jgi:hypothetical protein